MPKNTLIYIFILGFFISHGVLSSEITQISTEELNKLSPMQQLGAKLFFDTSLSSPAGQACASCHDPKTAYADSTLSSVGVSSGAVAGRLGSRNTPSIVYANYSPPRYYDKEDGTYIGGQFLDGRALSLSEQAKGPFLNPDEMNNRDEAEVIAKVRASNYAALFTDLFGPDAFSNDKAAYQNLVDAIASFEQSPVFNRFTSKYDYYLAGLVELTDQEKWGLLLFNNENKGNCAACHPSESDSETPPLFTDFSYDNIGIPQNISIPKQQGTVRIDLGLGKTVNSAQENGKFKVASLRNVALTAPYTHNGSFNTLRDVVDFYNTRDIDPKWGIPEIDENINREELGNLKLTGSEVDAIVAFMHTLTDGYLIGQTPNHLNNSGLISLPLVSVEGTGFKSTVMSVKLKQDDPHQNAFRLLYAGIVETVPNVSLLSLPHYALDSGILDIPAIHVDNFPDYIAQLRRVPAVGEFVVEVDYAKAMQ